MGERSFTKEILVLEQCTSDTDTSWRPKQGVDYIAGPILRIITDPADCLTERQNALESQASQKKSFFVPECENDGRYAQVQCYPISGYCWCVDQINGKQINLTAVLNAKPDCEKPIKADKPIKGIVVDYPLPFSFFLSSEPLMEDPFIEVPLVSIVYQL